ncbi:MAG: hypothetical protein MUF64_16765 [Polyangiaceae bacterium]|nr:hypothetical protein [Polyangiaceae bacterium]
MQRRVWGQRIAAHLGAPLLVACSSKSQPAPGPAAVASASASASAVVAAPSAPASVSASASASASTAPTGPGGWAPIAAPQPEVLHTPRVFRVAATDKGVLGLARSTVDGGGCAWNAAPDESCTGFFFAPWKDGKGSPARFPVGVVGEFVPVKVSRNWDWIWPGKQGAYALFSKDKKQTLGVLDGQSEQLFEVEGGTIEQVVETSQGPVALWMAGNVMSAPLTLQDGKATLGKPTMHRVMKARTAKEAREQIGRGQAPSVEWAAIPNMNDSGELDTAFLLTWSEVIPPERGSARVSASERRAVERRNFMCGFSPCSAPGAKAWRKAPRGRSPGARRGNRRRCCGSRRGPRCASALSGSRSKWPCPPSSRRRPSRRSSPPASTSPRSKASW